MKESRKPIFIEQLQCVRHCTKLHSRNEEAICTKITALGRLITTVDKVFALNYLEAKAKSTQKKTIFITVIISFKMSNFSLFFQAYFVKKLCV